MAKKLRFLFTLLFIMAATLSWGETTYKLEKVTSVEANGLYVFEQEIDSKKIVINNTIVSKAISTTETYKVLGLKGNETFVWLLEPATNGFYMKNVSLSSNQYLNNSSKKTDMSLGSKSSIWAFNFQTDGTALIQNTSNGNRFLGLTNEYTYKAYAESNLNSYEHAIVVYKLVEEGGDTPSKVDIATLNTISPTSVNVDDLDEFTLDATFAEGTVAGTDYNISWSSDNTSVLDVAGGTYEAKAVGTANVTVKVTPTDTEAYNEVSNTFAVTVIPAPFENIAKLTEQTASGTYKVQLNNAVVTYVNGNYAYIQDESGAIVLYKSGHGFTAGQILNGTAEVTFQIRNANPQITSITGYTATEGADPEPTVITASEWNTGIATVLSQWFKITGATITSESDKYYVQLGNETVQLYGQGEARTISVNDLTAKYTIIGFPTMYNSTPELQIFVQPEVETYNITATSNNGGWGTVLLEGTVITATPKAGYRVALENSFVVTSGTATVSQEGNVFTVNAETDCTVTINFEAIPTHTVTFSVNGENTQQTFAEGSNITFDTPIDDVNGKSFVGWTTAAIDGTTNKEPELVDLGTMGNDNVTFYAVFANVKPGTSNEVTDVLTRATTGVKEEATYSVWSGKKVNSDAIYAGQSAGDNNSIQLRTKNSNSGIITTTSGGKVKKVSVTWNSETTSERTLDIYGSNTAYTAATDLYGDNQGAKLGSIVYGTSTELAITGDYTFIGLRSKDGAMYLDNISITWETGTPATYSDYCTTVVKPVSAVSAPVIFHDEGTYEDAIKVAIAGEGTIMYKLGEGKAQTYSAPFDVSATTTVTAWTEQDGNKSDEVSKTFTIVEKTAGVEVAEGYYTIKNNGNGKFVNVAGRKTVTFTGAIDDKAGTVIKVKTNDKGQVEVLRSQGIDLPGYADKAMRYVPEIVKLVVDKLHAEGPGEILGENGLDAIMKKFNESFDYHLYIENANGNDNAGYRIYGKTPSMKPVVDFYAENKANVDYKLPKLEEFINSAIDKVLEKTGGRGQSILVDFSLKTVWEKMGSTLTEPVDEASTAKFYEEVLSSEANVWNFAYQTAMIYWGNVKNHPRYAEMKGKLGEYAKYLEKVENIRPNFKYYIVANTAGNDVDFISEGNADINAARATWTLEKRTDFKVTFNKENSINLGRELYTTLYTDFAYTVPEKVKAYKVTAIDEKTGLATKEEITGVIPAQTPVLLQMIVDPKTVTDADLTQTLTLSTEAGTAVTGNLLQGPDALINKYKIKTAQVVSLFEMAKSIMGEEFYNSYVKEYEHLQMKNAGTVNNKYFFGIGTAEDTENKIYSAGTTLRTLFKGDKKLGFYLPQDVVKANTAFILDETNPVLLSLVGDVTRDGKVNISDVTAQIDIILDKATPEDNYDYDAADVDGNGEIKIKDVTDLIDIILGKNKTE